MGHQRDAVIEDYLRRVVGAAYTFVEEVALDQIEIVPAKHQHARLSATDPDYIAGIEDTFRQGLLVRPLLLGVRSKTTKKYPCYDGIHRVAAARAAGRTHLPAYIVECDDTQAEFISSAANVMLNGQGLTPHERRTVFLAWVQRQSPTLTGAMLLKKPMLRRIAASLSVHPTTARRWVLVEKFKRRVTSLGLKMPQERFDEVPGQRARGDRGEAWILAASELNDEELKAYWFRLTAATSTKVLQMARDLKACSSMKARAELAETLAAGLIPNVKVMSQSEADRERRAAGQIRMHGAGLMKLQAEFLALGKKYPDVLVTLRGLKRLLENFDFGEEVSGDELVKAG